MNSKYSNTIIDSIRRRYLAKGDRSGFRWGVLVIVCLAIFILVIDTTMMNVSISALVVDLNTDISVIQAIIAIYALIMASLILLGGKLGDVVGRRKAFTIGLVIYTIGTATAALSINALMLLIGWAILEGIGAALMLPATATFITDSYKGKERAVAFGMWGGIAAAGAAFGPIIGGFLTTFYTWRLAFGLEVVIAIVILVLLRWLPLSRPTIKWKDLDAVGAVMSFTGLFLIVLGILQLQSYETWLLVPILMIAGGLIMLLFLLWQKRRIARGLVPLTDISLLKLRTFNYGNIVGIIQNLTLAGFLFIIPVFMQSVLDLDAFTTGLIILPTSLTVFIFSVGATRLSSIIHPKYLVLIGIAISMLGSMMLRDEFHFQVDFIDLLPGFLVFGTGLGLLLSQITNITLSAAGPEQQSDASGLVNTAKQLGTSLGTAFIGVVLIIAVFSSIVNGVIDTGLVPEDQEDEVAEKILEWFEKLEQGEEPDIPDDLKPYLYEITNNSARQGMRISFDTITVMLGIAFVAAILIPRSMKE
ncbi:MAG: MFS transporter [Methanomassiliicoccales archaeon]|nr:MFS transporter [Methanomassiliicoccales archaeon]NYT15490.1 MFS transporter [Methanomassiliicoccales archaeon]